MEAFLAFFENMESWQKLVWIFGVLTITSLIEVFEPLVNFDYKKWRHAGVNIVFLTFTMIINTLFSVAVVGVCLWTAENSIGLLNMINLPLWAELLLAVMALDFIAQYVAHVTLHKVGFMWRFHMIHHSDTHVDATTGTRHHPGDYVFRELFSLVAILLMGMPIAFYLFYRILTIPFTYFTHANIGMPKWMDKALSFVFITPNMHKFHHHFERPWTDTNYGNIFSFWDRIFGTLVYDDPKKVVYGLDVVDSTKDQSIGYQLGVPFNKDVKTDYMLWKPFTKKEKERAAAKLAK
jgi:sterol desaturase/sphingolipid hydroxylase (fatty acid hydroxylase superfamily)